MLTPNLFGAVHSYNEKENNFLNRQKTKQDET